MNDPKPLVSVFVPTYNGALFIEQTIESVLAQTYEHLELIVVDDCSSDGTVEILERYVVSDPRVKLLRNEVREGPCRARNRALAHTRGSLLCWLDHDDLWMSGKVEEQVALMSTRPEVGLVYTHFNAFDSRSGAHIDWPDGRRDIEGDVLAPLFLIGCFIGSITTMFRRESVNGSAVKLRERDFSFGDDYYLWLTIALRWSVACIPRSLAAYRRHSGNESARVEAESNVSLLRVRLLEEFLHENPLATDRLGSLAQIALAWHTLVAAPFEWHHGRRRRALRLTSRALSLDPAILARTRLGRRSPAARTGAVLPIWRGAESGRSPVGPR